ncbi:MAG: glycosyltransferase family 4 protein [Caldilineaceae bacterium]
MIELSLKAQPLRGVELVRIPTLPGKHLHATSLFLFAALHALFFGNYALVHVHNVEACFVLPLLRLRYKTIATSHGAAQARDKWGKFAKFLIRLTELPFIYVTNYVTCVSAPLTEFYRNTYGREVYFLPNGVDDHEAVDLAGAQELLAVHGIQDGQYILFAAGRVIPTKGAELLLAAFRELPGEYHLIVVGDTSQVPAYERELRGLADERVHFIPFVADKAVLLGLVSQCQLFVFPSTVEAMSMMLLEAATMQAPIVASDIPENVSVLPEQALFFKSGNVADLREKLAWSLTHTEAMSILAKKAKQHVTSNFQWNSIVKGYEELYNSLLDLEKKELVSKVRWKNV